MRFMNKYSQQGFLKVFSEPVTPKACSDAEEAQKARAYLFGYWSQFCVASSEGLLPDNIWHRDHDTYRWFSCAREYIYVGLPFDLAPKPFMRTAWGRYRQWRNDVGPQSGRQVPQHYERIMIKVLDDVEALNPWDKEGERWKQAWAPNPRQNRTK
jgi:hypothetical protein